MDPDAHDIHRILGDQRKRLDKIASATDRALLATWVTAWDDIATDIEMILAKAGAEGVTNTVRVRRAQQAIAVIARQLRRSARAAGVAIGGDVREMIEQAQADTVAMIGQQLEGVEQLAANMLRADPAQIEAIGTRVQKTVTARVWDLQADAVEAVRAELVRGVATGAHPNAQASRMLQAVQGLFMGGLTRARTIARTETIDAYRAAAMATEQANADVLAGWLWIADLGQRTCMSCVAQHGSLHKLEEPGPEDHPNGRCARVPVTKSWKQLGYKGIKDPPRPAKAGDGPRWLARQARDVQDHILTKRGAQAWRNGEWGPPHWSVPRDNPGWRRSWVAGKPPKH